MTRPRNLDFPWQRDKIVMATESRGGVNKTRLDSVNKQGYQTSSASAELPDHIIFIMQAMQAHEKTSQLIFFFAISTIYFVA